MNPWAIPQRVANDEWHLPWETEKLLSDSFDLSHSKAVALTCCSRWEIKTLWSNASQAAVKCKSISMTESPKPMVKKIPIKTFKSADSVLWFALKPDWNTSEILGVFKKGCSCKISTFSKILEMKRKLEIGLKLDNNQTLYIILSQAAAYKPLNISSNIVEYKVQ